MFLHSQNFKDSSWPFLLIFRCVAFPLMPSTTDIPFKPHLLIGCWVVVQKCSTHKARLFPLSTLKNIWYPISLAFYLFQDQVLIQKSPCSQKRSHPQHDSSNVLVFPKCGKGQYFKGRYILKENRGEKLFP